MASLRQSQLQARRDIHSGHFGLSLGIHQFAAERRPEHLSVRTLSEAPICPILLMRKKRCPRGASDSVAVTS